MGRAKSWEEYKSECEAVAKEGITVLGFVGHWAGDKTRLECLCNFHGQWVGPTISNARQGKYICPECKKEAVSKRKRLPKKMHVQDFLETGTFKEGTKFSLSEKRDSSGYRNYWDYTCPVCSVDKYVQLGLCSGIFSGKTSNLKRGKLSCRCAKNFIWTQKQRELQIQEICTEYSYVFIGWVDSYTKNTSRFLYACPSHGEQEVSCYSFLSRNSRCPECANWNQQQAYINTVLDQGLISALKIGIAHRPCQRLRDQNRYNLLKMESLRVYKFTSTLDCKAAERACLKELECGILTARELKDGWTETTSIQNLDKIIEIYERFGGVCITEEII